MAANQAQLALASDCGPQPENLGERDQRAPDERPFRQDPGHSTHHDLVAFVRGIFTGEDRVERGSRGLGNVEEGDQGVRNTLRVAALRMVGLHLTFFWILVSLAPTIWPPQQLACVKFSQVRWVKG